MNKSNEIKKKNNSKIKRVPPEDYKIDMKVQR